MCMSLTDTIDKGIGKVEVLMGYNSPDELISSLRNEIINKINDISSEKIDSLKDGNDETDY